MKLYIGKVTNNNSLTAPPTSPEIFGQTGAVQIFIEGIMSEFLPNQYHWFRPAQGGTGGSTTFGTSCIPETNSYVWCFYEDEAFYRKGFYIWNANLMLTNPHSLNTTVSASVGSSSTYPDVKYMHFKNGIEIAVSSSLTTPEITIYHPTGSHIFIDNLGNITFNASTQLTIKNTIASMKDLLTDIHTLLTSLYTVGNLSNGGGPVVIGTIATDTPTLLRILTSITALLKE